MRSASSCRGTGRRGIGRCAGAVRQGSISRLRRSGPSRHTGRLAYASRSATASCRALASAGISAAASISELINE